MSDQIREAAERLRLDDPLWKGVYHGPEQVHGDHVKWSPIVRRILADGKLVSDAYLAEHPADDAEPITEEWLRKVGGDTAEFDGEWKADFQLQIGDIINTITYWGSDGMLLISQGRDSGIKWPVPLRTRGDVRRLCAALGVELKALANE